MRMEFALALFAITALAVALGIVVGVYVMMRRVDGWLKDRDQRRDLGQLQRQVAMPKDREPRRGEIQELIRGIRHFASALESLAVTGADGQSKSHRARDALVAGEEFFCRWHVAEARIADRRVIELVERLRTEFVDTLLAYGSYPTKERDVIDRLPFKEKFDRDVRQKLPELCQAIETRLRQALDAGSTKATSAPS